MGFSHVTFLIFRIAQRVPITSDGHAAVPQQREGKPKHLNAVVAAHQAGMNVELLSDDSQRVIVRVRKLVVYLSSSQVTSKTAKLPKAQTVTAITTSRRKYTNRGAVGRFFLFRGCTRTFLLCRNRAGPGGIGLQPSFASTPVQTAFRRVRARIGRDRAESGRIGLQHPHQTASSPVRCGKFS